MKKLKKIWTFQTKLFLGVSSIVIVVILFLSLFFYSSEYQIVMQNESQTGRQITKNILQNIDLLFWQMNTASANIITNSTISNDISNLNNQSLSSSAIRMLETEIKSEATSVFFNIPSVSTIAIYNFEKGYYIYTGIQNDNLEYINQQMKNIDWYHSIMGKDSYKIFSPHQSYFHEKETIVLSLRRKFSFSNNIENNTENFPALVEIQIPYAHLEKLCSADVNPNSAILIFDESGQLAYPYQPDSEFLNTFSPDTIFSNIEHETATKKIQTDSASLYVTSQFSENTHWTVAYVTSSEEIDNRLLNNGRWIFFGACLINAVILLSFYFLIKHITYPLRQLTAQVKKVSLSNMNLHISAQSNDDLNLLCEAFSTTLSELQTSIKRTYEANLREKEARFTALQAQINPHFIYNTLHAIGAVCEKHDDFVPSEMCSSLADMMRYTIQNDQEIVSISVDLEYAKQYLKLMSIPYEGMVLYEIDIPQVMHKIPIPKLTLQPLIENSFKHGFKKKLPPWEIKISGIFDEHNWRIKITDNGIGFTPEAYNQLMKQITEYTQSNTNDALGMDTTSKGLGLLNIYSRLFIYQGKNAVFTIETDASHTTITIGGIFSLEQES